MARRVRVDRHFDSVRSLLSGYVVDLSEHGAFIHMNDLLPVGTAIDFRFSVVVGDIQTIEGEGEVIRVVERPEEGRGIAVRFDALTEKSRALVRELVGSDDYPRS